MGRARKVLERTLLRNGVIVGDRDTRACGLFLLLFAAFMAGGWLALVPPNSSDESASGATIFVGLTAALLAAGGLFLLLRMDRLRLDLRTRTYRWTRGVFPKTCTRSGSFADFSRVTLRQGAGGLGLWLLHQESGSEVQVSGGLAGLTDRWERDEIRAVAAQLAEKLELPLRDETLPPGSSPQAPPEPQFSPLDAVQGLTCVWTGNGQHYRLQSGERVVAALELGSQDQYLGRGTGWSAAGVWMLERRVPGTVRPEFSVRRQGARPDSGSLHFRPGLANQGQITVAGGPTFSLRNPLGWLGFILCPGTQVVWDTQGRPVLRLRRAHLPGGREVILEQASLPEADGLLLLTAFIWLAVDPSD